jgi:hypothetical protein
MRDRQDSRQPLPLANRSGGLESSAVALEPQATTENRYGRESVRSQPTVVLKAQQSQRFQEGN